MSHKIQTWVRRGVKGTDDQSSGCGAKKSNNKLRAVGQCQCHDVPHPQSQRRWQGAAQLLDCAESGSVTPFAPTYTTCLKIMQFAMIGTYKFKSSFLDTCTLDLHFLLKRCLAKNACKVANKNCHCQ